MKLERLRLIRFGPFTDLSLELATEGPAFHLLYGPNEAGKSTTLRAISGLLYGIPERSPDTHMHGGDLRIAATLADRNGHRLQITRRKGRKNTLLDAAGEPLPESALLPYLGGVDLALFERMYGLDHVRLRSGAEALLADGGAVGESLFEAGIGGRGVHRVLSDLRREAEELFLPRGRTRKLNEAIARFRDAHRRTQQLSLRADVYQAEVRVLEQSERERERLRAARRALSEERARLQRLLRVASPLSQRRARLEELAELGNVVVLPEEARKTRLSATRVLADCTPEIRQRTAELERLRERRAQLEVPESLAALNEDAIVAIRDQLGSHRKAEADMPRRKQQLRALQNEARTVLRRLGRSTSLGDVERLRVPRAQVVRIRELSRSHGGLRQAAEQSFADRTRLVAEVSALEPAAAPDDDALPSLRACLEAVKQLGDYHGRRLRLQTAIAQRQQALASGVHAIVPALPGTGPEALARAPLPLMPAVEGFAQAAQAADHRRDQLRARADSGADALRRVDSAIAG